MTEPRLLSPDIERRMIREIRYIDYSGKHPEDAPLDVEWVRERQVHPRFRPEPLRLYERDDGERAWAQECDQIVAGAETDFKMYPVRAYFVLGPDGWPCYWPIEEFDARYQLVEEGS